MTMSRKPETLELKQRLMQLSERRFREGMAPADFNHMLRTILRTRDAVTDEGEEAAGAELPPVGAASPGGAGRPAWLIPSLLGGGGLLLIGLSVAIWYLSN